MLTTEGRSNNMPSSRLACNIRTYEENGMSAQILESVSSDGVPPQNGCVVSGQMTKASNQAKKEYHLSPPPTPLPLPTFPSHRMSTRPGGVSSAGLGVPSGFGRSFSKKSISYRFSYAITQQKRSSKEGRRGGAGEGGVATVCKKGQQFSFLVYSSSGPSIGPG